MATVEATARVSVEAPPVVTLAGLKVPVTPAGAPERDSPMLSALPETRVVLTVVPPEVPWDDRERARAGRDREVVGRRRG